MSVRAMRRAVSEADKDLRREEILAAAARVFADNGFHATTIADIAKAARLSYGSVYWYFDSKEALFQVITERQEQALWAHVATAVDGAADPAATLTRAVRATFEFFAADPAAARLLSLERFTRDIEGLVADAQHRGEVVQAPPGIVAFSVATLIGALATRLASDDDVDPATAADVVVTLLLDGLRPR